MNPKIWHTIAEETITKAEAVKCSIEEFYDGLDTIIEELQTRREVGREEIGR